MHTSSKEYVLVCNVKLVYNIAIIPKSRWHHIANNSKVALCYILQISKEKIIFLDLIRIMQINPKSNQLLLVPMLNPPENFLNIYPQLFE